MTHLEYYNNRFNDEISRGIVEVCQGLSWEQLELFPDDYFDYVYLDAGHDYQSVKKDIELLKVKVKQGGIIQFNDYTLADNFGVIPAVNDLILNTNSEVMYYCFELYGYADLVIKLNKSS